MIRAPSAFSTCMNAGAGVVRRSSLVEGCQAVSLFLPIPAITRDHGDSGDFPLPLELGL